MFETIMVPVDGSKYGDEAVDYAIAIAEKFNSKLVAVHVLEEFSNNSYDFEEDNGNDILAKITTKASDLGIQVIEHLITGNALRDMKTIVRKTNADLVVMHAFGSNTFDMDLNENQIGSVSERIIRTGDVPVLLVK